MRCTLGPPGPGPALADLRHGASPRPFVLGGGFVLLRCGRPGSLIESPTRGPLSASSMPSAEPTSPDPRASEALRLIEDLLAEVNAVTLTREQIADVHARFEADWRAGRCPRIEDYLSAAPEPDRPALRKQLLALELRLRYRGGEPLVAREYRRRFPDEATLIDDLCEGLCPPEPTERVPAATPGAQTIAGALTPWYAPPTARATERAGQDEPTLPDEVPPVIPGYKVLGKLGRGGTASTRRPGSGRTTSGAGWRSWCGRTAFSVPGPKGRASRGPSSSTNSASSAR
jgi:hypothetical protein